MDTEKFILLFGCGAYIFAVDCLSIYQPLFQLDRTWFCLIQRLSPFKEVRFLSK